MGSVKGKYTGKIHTGHYQVFVMADGEDYYPTLYVNVVQLVYGSVESTMAGGIYRHTLGETLIEQSFSCTKQQWDIANQVDRSVAVAPKEDGIVQLPYELQWFARAALAAATK